MTDFGVFDTAEELMDAMKKHWETLTFTNDFVFCKTMLNEEICREVLEAILGFEIESLEYIGRQEQLDASPEAKGVRLDVIVKDTRGFIYNVEMQATDTRELPRRSRYYHAMLALDQVQRGDSYAALKDTFVIFVCGFDLFGLGRRVYYFENVCRDVRDLPLGDGARTIFLAADAPGSADDDARLGELLDYVATGEVTGDLSARIHAEVANVLDSEKWRAEYMYLEVRDHLNYSSGLAAGRDEGFKEGREAGMAEGREVGLAEGREAGRAEGREAGIAEGREAGRAEGRKAGLAEGREAGRAEGEDKFARLAAALVQEGRADDIALAAADPAFRQELYEALGVV